MRFSVDRHYLGDWTPVGEVDASGARQAIARAASGSGLYRVNPSGTRGLNEAFIVPDWGVPRRVPAGPDAAEACDVPSSATYEAVREAAALAGIRARLGCARALENRAWAKRLRASSATSRHLRASALHV
ncbi:MAG: hypothetical protein JST53_12490 [Actinobacteria bacterium]|nr:hypothetical protein [Actinomycetota bacterium]